MRQLTDAEYDALIEYKQVAQLACLDLDLLAGLADRSGMTLEGLRKHIHEIHGRKEEAIRDPSSRQSRYASLQALRSAVSKGLFVTAAPDDSSNRNE